MRERAVRNRIKLSIGGRMDTILMSNPSGLGVVGKIQRFKPGADKTNVYNPRYISFGLGAMPGQQKGGEFPDFIGCRTVTITPEMVGKEIAVFVGIEAKGTDGTPTPGQLQKIALLKSHGALAGVAYNVEDAEAIIEL